MATRTAAPLLSSYNPAVEASAPISGAERITVIDVLRGIALLGMLIVHFRDVAIEPAAGAGHAYGRFVQLFFEDRFYTMFGILFGIGFGIQLRRADARRERFAARYTRRLLALAVFGFVAEGIFGYNVLLAYALWGFALLLVRRWSTRALLILLVACSASFSIFALARTGIAEARGHTTTMQQMRRARRADNAADSVARAALSVGERSTNFATVIAARIRYMPWSYTRPYMFLPTNELTLFLIGLLALRCGIIEHPERHQRLILGSILFGAASWAARLWLLGVPLPPPPASPFKAVFIAQLYSTFNVLRDMWLSFAYVGAVLLLAARRPAWLAALRAFGTTGRMALTNYLLQVIVLDLAFSNYAFGLTIPAVAAPLAALLLFAIEWSFCRWWLARFRYGPLEWVWRAVTYWRIPPMRAQAVT